MRIDSSFIADFVVAALVYLTLLFTLWRKKGAKRILLNSIAYFYIVAVLTVTIMPVIENIKYIGSFPYRYMRLIPFDDYNCGRVAAFKQIVLNTVMFIPFGFLLPLIRKHNLLTVTLLSAAFSVFRGFPAFYKRRKIQRYYRRYHEYIGRNYRISALFIN